MLPSSAVVVPGRWPVSRSCWRTGRRSVSGVQPILAVIDWPLRFVLYSLLASLTMRSALDDLGEYYGCFFIGPLSQAMKPLRNFGRFTIKEIADISCRNGFESEVTFS